MACSRMRARVGATSWRRLRALSFSPSLALFALSFSPSLALSFALSQMVMLPAGCGPRRSSASASAACSSATTPSQSCADSSWANCVARLLCSAVAACAAFRETCRISERDNNKHKLY